VFIVQTRAEVINVADHGIVPGKDVTMEINQLIEYLKGESTPKSIISDKHL
jgi:hypothetical protein